MQKNPWGSEQLSPEHAVLFALGPEAEETSVIAQRAGLSEAETKQALQALVAQHLAIEDDGSYELTGPLSWFGNFANAIAHDVRKRFVVRAPNDSQTHLYLDEVRVKGSVRPGDPANETVAVFACARTSPQVTIDSAAAPTCPRCAKVLP